MHTLFTLMTYATLAIAPRVNGSLKGQSIKIALCFLVTSACWESRAVFGIIWRPLTFLVGYQDPRRTRSPISLVNSTSTTSASNAGQWLVNDATNRSIGGRIIESQNRNITADKLHEWHFRSSLDRYVWIYGMACAAAKPWVEKWLEKIDLDTSKRKKVIVRSAIALVAVAALGTWFHAFGSLPKLQYNKIHPFTSWIPITSWIVLRNLTPTLRRSHLALFSWLGCITLESYIAQFHTWLSTEGGRSAQGVA